jgi:hypothetical protein
LAHLKNFSDFRRLFCVVVMTPTAPGAHAQTPADRMATVYQNQLTLIESDVVSLAEAMPADGYDFRPADGEFTGARTFGEQVRHLATMIYMTAAIVREEKSPHGPGPTTMGLTISAPRRRSSPT